MRSTADGRLASSATSVGTVSSFGIPSYRAPSKLMYTAATSDVSAAEALAVPRRTAGDFLPMAASP
eukprot:CAMPEP_0119200932 /NCGR_PEP_ID=MMETSP1316-20130426/27669_1 /TAXON_ID=41880 /ORGANISM="Pycnococcus provasolii, Strain RCC2336" /LENGTH=65 /DNA_ID=CAMNT_0007197021 /DNA_START=43 /DNA_END=236 /DNA_ORIENTATION=-